jgi:hypothetical protein
MVPILEVIDTLLLLWYGVMKIYKYFNKSGVSCCYEKTEMDDVSEDY